MRQYLSSINAASDTAINPNTSAPHLADLARTNGSPAIISGTPKQVRDGVCGDGIINGANEDCDQGAIQNVNCSDYGGLFGRVTCQPNCLYNISECMTPVVDHVIGGIAETCRCQCGRSLCRGNCSPSNAVAQTLCRFDCDNDCVCRCQGRTEAHIENCEFQCACTVDISGFPRCECTLDQCDIITSIAPNIASLAIRQMSPYSP